MQAWSTDVVSKAGPLKASSANSVLIHHVPLFTRNVSKRLLQLLPDFCDVDLTRLASEGSGLWDQDKTTPIATPKPNTAR